MRQVVLHMMVTADNCVSGPNGELDWLFEFHDAGREKCVSALYHAADGMLVGSETYKGMAGYWVGAAVDPASQEGEREFARLMNAMPKYVFSKTLEKAEWENSRVVSGDVAEEVSRLKAQSGRNLVLTGGLRIAQTFVKLGLIDEYELIVHPVVLGKGKRLFDIDDLEAKQKLKLLAATPFEAGIVALHYQKA
jgi:dihydrofolate reductase